MTKHKWLLISLAVLLLVSAAGIMEQPALARDEVRLTVDNRSGQPAYLRLEGPRFYYLTNPAGAQQDWTIQAGEYSYTLSACGSHTLTGTIDLTRNQRFVVPTCGDRAFSYDKGATVDVGRELRLVRVTLTGREPGTLLIILQGPSTYVFSLPQGEAQHYTIRKGDYNYTLYGCPGSVQTGVLHVFTNRDFDIRCP